MDRSGLKIPMRCDWLYERCQANAYLKEKEIAGGLSLLDSEPLMASVTAVEDSRLLRLDQDVFYELMENRMEVARGIIQVLTRRLRNWWNVALSKT